MKDNTRWVKDYVSTLEWEWFTDVPVAHFWEYARLRANKEDIEWQGKVIPRGSFISSVGHMSIECGLSPKQIRLAISKLEKTGEITTIRANKYTQINVVKYADYQSVLVKEGKQKGKQKEEQRETQRDTERATILDIKTIRDIENKEIYKESSRHKYGSYSNVLLSDEEMEKLKAEFPNDYENRIERVSEYCASTGKSYKNYLATIRNWARKEKPRVEEPKREYTQPWLD